MSDTLKQKAITGISWSFVEQILTRGANFVINIIIARLLTPSDYGLIGMMGIFIAISQLFVDGGLSNALIKQKNPSDRDYSTVFITNVTFSVVFYFILFACAPAIARFYEQPLLKDLVRAVSLVLVIGSLGSIQGTLLTIRVDFKTKTWISIGTSLLSGAVGIYCAYRGMGVWSLVAQSLTAATVAMLMTHALVRWMPRLVFSMESFKRLFGYSSKLLLSSVISTAYAHAYPMVIGKRFSSASVGEYTRGDQFPGIANETIVSALNRVSFPVLSKIQDDEPRLLDVFEKFIRLCSFLIFPVLMCLCGCARPLIQVLLKEQWLNCVPLLQIICFSRLTSGMIAFNLNLLYVKGRSDLALQLEIVKKLFAITVLLVSMFFGVKSMCVGLVINSFIDLYVTTRYTKRVAGTGILPQLKVAAPYFGCSLVVLAESLLITEFVHPEILSLCVSLVLCIPTYLLLTRVLNLYAWQEVRKYVLQKMNKA